MNDALYGLINSRGKGGGEEDHGDRRILYVFLI
jgi:hypothetical protein